MRKLLIGDTSFWIGLFILNDPYHDASKEVYEKNVDTSRIIIPWPAMYETLRTSFVRNYHAVARLEKEFRKPIFIKYQNRAIRNRALQEVFDKNGSNLSLTDARICEIVKSGKTQINSVITSNKGDFIDVCRHYKVGLHERYKNCRYRKGLLISWPTGAIGCSNTIHCYPADVTALNFCIYIEHQFFNRLRPGTGGCGIPVEQQALIAVRHAKKTNKKLP